MEKADSVLRATENHVYRSPNDLAGKGATCEVYRGIHKGTGEIHALKIYEARLRGIAERELEALRTLKHENIVAFLGQETEVKTMRLVAVMEYCEKSLYNSLCEPENSNGLSEDEYLRFFKHIVDGLKHLREHGFLHRDIKPGNILLAQDETGRNIYKLSDFGTAKPILETEAFQSLVGTEEYLHPNIFKAAFIDKEMSREFDAAADLWSLGATLYHAATGNVPFQPYGGRNDRTLMFRMIAQKEFGVISGEQRMYNGAITWSKELPDTCPLSKWMRQVLTEVLSRLLEIDPMKASTFDTFFNAAEDILKRRILYVFSTTSAMHFRLYMNPDATYDDLQQEISIETNIPPKDQYLHYEQYLLKDIIRPKATVQDFPKLSSTTPIVLIRSTGVAECVMPEESNFWYLQKGEDFEVPRFPDKLKQLSEDYSISKTICNRIAQLKHKVDLSCLTQELFEKTINRSERWTDLLVNYNLKTEVELYRDRVKDMRHIHAAIKENAGILCFTPDVTIEDLKYKAASCSTLLKKVQDTLTDTSFRNYEDSCYDEHRCQKKIDILLDKAKEKKAVFESRKKKNLPFHEEQLHKFDRTTLLSLLDKATKLWETHCQQKLKEIHAHFLKWHKAFAELQTHIESLQREVKGMRSAIKNYTRNFKVSQEADPLLSPPVSIDGPSINPPTQSVAKMMKTLEKVQSSQQEIRNLADETASLNIQSMELIQSNDLDTLIIPDEE